MSPGVLVLIVSLGMFALIYYLNTKKDLNQPPPPPLENFTQTSSVTCGMNQNLQAKRDEFGNIVFDCVGGGAEGFSPMECPDPTRVTRRTLPNGAVLLSCANRTLDEQTMNMNNNNEPFGLVPGKTCQFKTTQDSSLGKVQTCVPLREFNPMEQETFTHKNMGGEPYGTINIQPKPYEAFETLPFMSMGSGSTFGRREAFEEPSFSAGGYGGIDIKPNIQRACTNSERLVAVNAGQGITNFECQALN